MTPAMFLSESFVRRGHRVSSLPFLETMATKRERDTVSNEDGLAAGYRFGELNADKFVLTQSHPASITNLANPSGRNLLKGDKPIDSCLPASTP